MHQFGDAYSSDEEGDGPVNPVDAILASGVHAHLDADMLAHMHQFGIAYSSDEEGDGPGNPVDAILAGGVLAMPTLAVDSCSGDGGVRGLLPDLGKFVVIFLEDMCVFSQTAEHQADKPFPQDKMDTDFVCPFTIVAQVGKADYKQQLPSGIRVSATQNEGAPDVPREGSYDGGK